MRILQINTIIVVALTALGLTACKSHNSSITGGGSAITGLLPRCVVRTYALVGKSGYIGKMQKDADGRIINPLVAPANQTYYFDFDSTASRPLDLKAIQIQANYLATHPTAKIRLEGNTDNRGSREYNIGLGWRRDKSVVRILEQAGVVLGQIDIVSYGKERPAVVGDNEATWKLNRRVNLIYEAY